MTGSRVAGRDGWWLRWWLPLVGALVLALAGWARAPAVPNLAPEPPAAHASRAVNELREEVARAVALLRGATARALDVPADPRAAFAALPAATAGDPEWGLILYEGDRPLAWSGRIRLPTHSLRQPVQVLSTPFYTVISVVSGGRGRRAVGVVVVHAVAPADRLAYTLVERVTRRVPVAGFTLAAPSAAGGTAILIDPAGRPLLTAEPIPLSSGELRLREVGDARVRIVALLAIVVLGFLALVWRRGTLAERVAALAVVLAAIAIIPWNTFSSRARLFDPTFFFTAVGGPWTASGGVFLLTAIVATLVVLALVRGRPRVRSVGTALAASAGIAVAGFFVIRALANGIGQPARDATTGLWLTWEVPLFLVTAAALLPIAWMLETAVRRRRNISRRVFVGVLVTAAVVASTLVWLTTVGQRMRLAEADIAALERGEDRYVGVLLERFARALAAAPPARDRITLLQRYAESELAAAGYPLALGSWDEGGALRAQLDVTRGVADSVVAAAIVARARENGRPMFAAARGQYGALWISAVPHATGEVTSVTVAPPSRVLDPDPFLPLLGASGARADVPPYTITLADDRAPPGLVGLRWRRERYQLHADAPLRTSDGVARAHIELDLRSPEALLQRLVLVVLLNLIVMAALVLLVRAAERDFARRARVRLRHWRQSYRARLTLALFAFFIVPAATFTLWGYRRLTAASRQSRQLVVRETLHAASAARGENPLSVIGRELGTPLFAYANGVLTEVSDSLYEALAPVGRALPPPVHIHLSVAEEPTATWEEPIGGVPVFFGYRAVSGNEGTAVLAAPSRGEDPLLARRARDLTVLLLFGAAIGALAALWLSGLAAHQFGRPIAALRRAARAVARGDRRPPELPAAPTEFEPVFAAFRRMAADLERSRTEMSRAERVLAWGEMARQVAHEIKNPLTPMRLGVQYLQRARRDPRVDFDAVFEENTRHMLAEIDRLDEIARAFSRYGSAPAELPSPEPVDVAAVLRDLVAFERIGAESVSWTLDGAAVPCAALARSEELREVLLNLYENARAAEARFVRTSLECTADGVTIEVRDDGTGIAPDVLPRIFEPHFSTRTTGSGLGLAISRRLLDSWGGSMAIASEQGGGTLVTITLRAAISSQLTADS